MKYKPGKYLIIKHGFWTINDSETITIVTINKDYGMVKYFYDNEETTVRERCFVDFDMVDLVECTPLIEELL